eukprot:8016705-Pyramimonas_sp.AAC.1
MDEQRVEQEAAQEERLELIGIAICFHIDRSWIKDLERRRLDKFSRTASLWGQRAVVCGYGSAIRLADCLF